MNTKLALNGGPATVSKDAFQWPRHDQSISEALESILQDGSWGAYHGASTHELVKTLCERFGGNFSWPCCSGTFAVELALRGSKVDSGEVIMAGYDFPGNFRAIEGVGAKPVLVDVFSDGWTLDSESLLPACSEETRAIVVSHLHGQSVNVNKVQEIAKSFNPKIVVIEDCCQSPRMSPPNDAQFDGNFSHGDVRTYSFGGSKLLTAGRGGAIVTDDQSIWQRAKIFCERGNDAFPLSQLQAAVLKPQLDNLAQQNQLRMKNLKHFVSATANLRFLKIGPNIESTCGAIYKVPFTIDGKSDSNDKQQTNIDRDWIVDALKAEGVEAGPGFRGFMNRGERRCKKIGTLENSVRASEQTILLQHSFLSSDESHVNQVAAALSKVDNFLSSQTND